jgi:hypothetical protein
LHQVEHVACLRRHHLHMADVAVAVGQQHQRAALAANGDHVACPTHQACGVGCIGAEAAPRRQGNNAVDAGSLRLEQRNVRCRAVVGLLDLNLAIGPNLGFAAVVERQQRNP